MSETFQHINGLHQEIENKRLSIRQMTSSEWYSDLNSNLRKLIQITEYILDYLVTSIDEPSKENLVYIHVELTFMWKVIKEDVINIRSALINKHPGWKVGVKTAESIYKTDLMNVIDAIREYIQLQDKAPKLPPKNTLDAQRYINAVSRQRRISTDTIMTFRDKFVMLLNSLVDHTTKQ